MLVGSKFQNNINITSETFRVKKSIIVDIIVSKK